MKCDISIGQLGACYRLRAHSELGRKYLASLLSAPIVTCTHPHELVVDELPKRIHWYVHAWRVHQGDK